MSYSLSAEENTKPHDHLAVKNIGKAQHTFMINTINKLGLEEGIAALWKELKNPLLTLY